MEQHEFPELAAIEKFLIGLRDTPRGEVDPIDMIAFGLIHQIFHLLEVIEDMNLVDKASLDS